MKDIRICNGNTTIDDETCFLSRVVNRRFLSNEMEEC